MAADTGNGETHASDLPPAVVEDILASERRQLLLSCLTEEGPMTVDDLATEVCAGEQGVSPDRVAADERHRVREEIYDRHLPKLTATGVVEYDSMRERVELANEDILRER